MRKECKARQNVEVVGIQGYHNGSFGSESYAYDGFKGRWYLNSDRKLPLDEHFRRLDGQSLKGFGLEIETECRGVHNRAVLAEIMDKVIFPRFKFGSVQFKMQSDASLHGDTSVEVISQVMTKSRIRNDFPAYYAMFNEYFPTLGISADAATTSCGMHVNVSNAIFGDTEAVQVDNIMKLHYLMGRHYRVMCKAVYRPENKTYWADVMDADTMESHNVDAATAARFDWRNARNIKPADMLRAPRSHNCCLNMSHFRAGRVEIRLVGGQKDYYCFRNTMEVVFFLTEKVRSLKWEELDDLRKVFSGCNQYVMKRLPDCGLDAETLDAIRATVKPEDLELRR